MGNKDSKSLPEENVVPDPDSSESEDSEIVFPSDPDIKGDKGTSDAGGLNAQSIQPPSPSRSKSRSPKKTSKKSNKKLSAPVKSFKEFLESCNAIPDYNSVATIEYARKFIHDGFSKCSGDDLSTCLTMLLEYFYKSYEKINMYRDIFYLIYKDSRYTHYSTRVFSTEFEKVFQQEKTKISENSKWGEIVMFGSLLCELLSIYQADTFLITKQLSNWTMELIKSAMEGNENGLIAYMLILKRLSTVKFPLKERFDHDLGVLKILLRDGNAESKTQEIYNYLEQRRLSQLADYESLEESIYTQEISTSEKCREIEKFLKSDNEKISFDINLFYDITDNELEFFARKFIEVGIEKPQKIKFLAFVAYKFQSVLNSIRKIINIVVKQLEEEIEVLRLKSSKNSIPINNFAKFIAELYINEKKIISPVMMTSWLSLLTELGESTAVASTLKLCGYFYKIDEPENFDKFMDSISIFWAIVNDEMNNISDQLNGKGQEVYADYLKSRMFEPNPSATSLDDLEMFLFETSRSKNFNFDFQNLLEFRFHDMYSAAKTIIKEVSRPNSNVIKLAEFLKSFFNFSYKIGKFVKRLKINFESRISEMTVDNPEEMKNVGKLIGELRNLTVIDKIPQEKWLEMIESFNQLKNSKVMEIHLEVLKVMLQNLLIHDEDRYMEYLKDIKAVDTSDLKIKSKILQITQNTVDKKIDKSSKDVLFKVRLGSKIEGFPQGIPAKSQIYFDLRDFVKVFLAQAISNRFLMGTYTGSMKYLTNGRQNDFAKILLDLCKDRFKNILNPELFDEDEAIGTLKIIRNLFKPSILTEENNEAFLKEMLEFKDFDNHKNCFKILLGMIKSVVILTETRKQGESNKNLKALLRKVEIKLTGVEQSSLEDEEEVEVWHIVDYQGYTNEISLLESETIEPSQLAWSFTENYQENQRREKMKLEKFKSAQSADNSAQSSKASNLFNQHIGRSPQHSNHQPQRTNQNPSNLFQNSNKPNKNDKKSKEINWNLTRDDLKQRIDLKNDRLPQANKRIDQNSFLYWNDPQNAADRRQRRPEIGQNWRQNQQTQKSHQNQQNLRSRNQNDVKSNETKPNQGSKNGQNLEQNQQKLQSISNPKLASATQQGNNIAQNSSNSQTTISRPTPIQDPKTDNIPNVQNSVHNTQNTSSLNKNDQSAQKTNKTDLNPAIVDKSTSKVNQNVQNLVQNYQAIQKSNVSAQKEPKTGFDADKGSNSGQNKIDKKSDENLKQLAQNSKQQCGTLQNVYQNAKSSPNMSQDSSQKTQNLNKKTENSNQKPQNSQKIIPQATENRNPPPTTQLTQNMSKNFNKLPLKPAPADLTVTFNKVMPLISSSTVNFRNCAILIHGWGLENPAMKPAIKELTNLLTKELLLNHKQLLVDVTVELNNECDELRRRQGIEQIQQKNIFVTTVKAVMPFLVKCAFYNMLDDLLGQIKNGNQIALALFLDLTEGMKEFLTENCRERDQFVPNCVIILERAIKFKGEEATRKRTFEMFKFFEGQKVNTAKNCRDNSNSRMRKAGSTQSVSSSNASEKKIRKRRYFWNQNNQGRGMSGSGGKGDVSKVNNIQKSGNITSKSNSGQKSGNITSIMDNITSKSARNASNSQNSINDPPENFKIDDKIKFYINQLSPSNTAAIGLKITPFLNKELSKRKVLDTLLNKGVSNEKFINHVIDLFEFLFKNNDFKATKYTMADIIGNEFIHVCENDNKNYQTLSNYAKFTRAFESFLKNSFIFHLWRELLEFVKYDTPNVIENLVFMMTDRLELFYETKGRKEKVKEFLMVFKEKLNLIKDKDLKIKTEKIIKSLESGEIEAMKQQKKTRPDNKISESPRQVEKVIESPAQKTKNLMKLLGISDDEEDCDLFSKIKDQIQSGTMGQTDQMGNTKFGQKSDQNDLKEAQNDNKLLASGGEATIGPEKSTQSVIESEIQGLPEYRALLDLQNKFQQIAIQNSSNSSSNEQESGPDAAKSLNFADNKQAKLIQGLTKQLDSLEIQDKSSEDKRSSSTASNESGSSSNQDEADQTSIKAVKPEQSVFNQTTNAADSQDDTITIEKSQQIESSTSDATEKDKLDSSASTQPIKKSTCLHPEDRIRPLMFSSDYMLFDESIENRRKFAEIIKVMCRVSDENKNSIEIRENIAKAIIKLNYLKIRTDSDEFYDFAEMFFKIYTKLYADQRSFSPFVTLKFLKAWKFYEENLERNEEELAKIYDRSSKSVCRIKKAFVVSSEEPMEGDLASRLGNITSKSDGSGTGTIPKTSNITSELGNITSKSSNVTSKSINEGPQPALTSNSDQQKVDQSTSSFFNKFMHYLTHILTSFLTGHETIKQEYNEEAIKARRPGICQLICDLYFHGITSADLSIKSIEILLESSDNNPENFNFISKIIKNVGALLEIREKEKFDEIFQIIFSKIRENPEKVAEIFEIRKSRYANVENFTPIFLLFHENPGKFFGFIETLWKRLMENPEKVADLSEIVEELLENLDEKFAFLISEFMENRRISFEKIPAKLFSKIVCQRLKGSILFSFELFEMKILSSERFAGWFKDEVYGKLGNDEKDEIFKILYARGMKI